MATVDPLTNYIIDFVISLLPSEQSFTEDYINATLKRNRRNRRYISVWALEDYENTERVYKSYEAGSYWATDLAVSDLNRAALSPTSTDHETGVVTFNTDTEEPRIYYTGYEYDPYGAAADLLRTMAANAAAELTTFTGAVGSFSRSEKSKSYEARANELMTLAKFKNSGGLEVVQLVRDDS